MQPRLRALPAVATSCVLALSTTLLLGGAPASAQGESGPPEPEGEVTNPEDFVVEIDTEEFVSVIDLDEFVEELGGSDAEEDNVIVLETDILFSPNEWELPANASARIAEIVEEVPESASVDVHGHTDSRPVNQEIYDFDNVELSENRAQAVADALQEERPDLQLNVEGFGDSQPAVTEDEEDPSTFAANRRVEIRFDG
ncbi:OmpA/MotB family protein [Nesterenkonia alba]|uniref:OmpA/MotB family protein n=1 Tax=Nesterenkonia alba TaxID=515814 RepID=UPI0003B39609|nr:OmpA family protein [Nesterenkonia alba]